MKSAWVAWGGAIPANTAKAVAAELIKQGRIVRGWTGVEVQPLLRSLSVKDVRGVLVRGALEGSPAAAAGFRQGDIITAVNGQEVSADCDELMPAFYRLVAGLRPGVDVPFTVRRGDQVLTLNLQPLIREANEARERELTAWGLTVRNLTRMSALYTKRPNTQGVLVDSLRPGGPAAEAKPALMEGDIILTVAGSAGRRCRGFTASVAGTTPGQGRARAGARGVCARQFADAFRRARWTRNGSGHRAPRAEALGRRLHAGADRGNRQGTQREGEGRCPRHPSPPQFQRREGWPEGRRPFGEARRQGHPGPSTRGRGSLRRFAPRIPGRRGGRPRRAPRWASAHGHAALGGSAPRPPPNSPRSRTSRFGFSARQLGYDDKVQRKVATETQGVIVTKVERSGWADLSGLRAGDIVFTINGTPVTDNLTLRAALAQLAIAKPRHVVFQVRRSISGAYLEFEPDWAAFESTK